MSFTFLGSDGVLKFRRPVSARANGIRQGQITLQHGDVVGVQTGAEGLEVIAHQDGFGFRESYLIPRDLTLIKLVCIGRQIYRLDKGLDKEIVEGPIAYIPDKAKERVPVPPPARRQPNPPPPLPTKLPHVPLTYWYIGPFPLDPERPLKVQPSARIKPSDITMPIREEDPEAPKRYTGIELDTNAEEAKILDPPPLPNSGKKRKPTEQSENGADKENGKDKEKGEKKEKGKSGGKGDKAKGAAKVGGNDGKTMDGSPAKKKSRKSAGAKA
jgi:hypothetical protein